MEKDETDDESDIVFFRMGQILAHPDNRRHISLHSLEILHHIGFDNLRV